MNKGRAFLLTGKVASRKTTYARKIETDGNAVFLSIDELQLSIFGSSPTRELLESYGIEVELIYFKITNETRMKWNAFRNSGNDQASFKI